MSLLFFNKHIVESTDFVALLLAKPHSLQNVCSFNFQEWLTHYSRRRYGKSSEQVEDAWKILHRTIYNCTDGIAVHICLFLVSCMSNCSCLGISLNHSEYDESSLLAKLFSFGKCLASYFCVIMLFLNPEKTMLEANLDILIIRICFRHAPPLSTLIFTSI